MEDVAEVRVGRSNVKFGGVDLGFTLGEISLSFAQEFRRFRPDQSTLNLKDFLLNEDVEVTIPFAQSLARSMARGKVFAAGELKATPVGSGGSGLLVNAEVAGSVTLTLDVGEGTNFTADDFALVGSGLTAQLVQIDSIATDVLTLKAETPLQFAQAIGATVVETLESTTRIAVGDASGPVPSAVLDIIPLDNSDPIRIYLATSLGEIEVPFAKAEETVYEVTYMGRSDLTRAKGDRLFSIGDQSVT